MCHRCTPDLIRQDHFSPDQAKRYLATRIWDESRPSLLVVMSNPSHYNTSGDNPTVQSTMAIACNNGYGAVRIVNFDPRLSATPLVDADILDEENLRVLHDELQQASDMWLAWGGTMSRDIPDSWIQSQLNESRARVWVLGYTASGKPLHPARKAHASKLVDQ